MLYYTTAYSCVCECRFIFIFMTVLCLLYEYRKKKNRINTPRDNRRYLIVFVREYCAYNI